MSTYALTVARRIAKGYGRILQRVSKCRISIYSLAKNMKYNTMHRNYRSSAISCKVRHIKRHSSSKLCHRSRIVPKLMTNSARYCSNSGLAGIIICDTKISTVGHKESGLMYNGFSINDLSTNCQFEEIAYLLTRKTLPNKTELAQYIAKINQFYHEIPPDLLHILEMIPKHSHAMDVMKITCAFIGTQYNEQNIFDIDETLNICDRLLALFPAAMCYHHRYHFYNDKQHILFHKNTKETIAQRIIRLLNGDNNKIAGYDMMVDAMNKSLICYAEHGLAASTFATRVTASTLSDSYSSILSGICTLKGTLHGGANESALELIDSFNGDVLKAESGINEMLNDKQLIMGFGHRIYKYGDPRSKIMKETALKLQDASQYAAKDKMKVAQTIERIMINKKNIHTNMDFYAAMVYFQCGIPKDLYTPIFVCARTTGWFAHILEQREKNKLIRPSADYNGPELKQFVHINDRE